MRHFQDALDGHRDTQSEDDKAKGQHHRTDDLLTIGVPDLPCRLRHDGKRFNSPGGVRVVLARLFAIRSSTVRSAVGVLKGFLGTPISAKRIVSLSAIAALLSLSLSSQAQAATWWVPPLGNQPWQWELSNPLKFTSVQDMGTDDKLPNGKRAPAPVIYDIDGIINPASTVARLHAMGKHVVCYIEVGAAGDYYSAVQEGISTTYYDQLKGAGEFGNKVAGYPEYYLNIQSPTTVSIIESMIARQCAAKGFDAVETDIDEEYADDSGFPLTKTIEENYMTILADYMHSLGLGWWIKNPDDTGDSYARDMFPLADAVLTEQCNQYSTCHYLSAYVGHKAVFNAEYQLKPSAFCKKDDALGFNGAQFNVALTGIRNPCR